MTSWDGMGWHGTVRDVTVWHGTVRDSMARHGIAWHCMALHGVAWHRIGWHSAAYHDIVLVLPALKPALLGDLGMPSAEQGFIKPVG